MRYIDKKTYDELIKSRNTLCDYCEVNECEYCIVTRLLDDAYCEAVESGIEEE